MKVLQSIGIAHKTSQVSVFQYRRTVDGVEVDFIGATTKSPSFIITHADWGSILFALAKAPRRVQRLTQGKAYSVRDAIQSVSTSASANFNQTDDSHLAAVIAILEHEGSLDIYGGPAGRKGATGNSVAIYLRPDVKPRSPAAAAPLAVVTPTTEPVVQPSVIDTADGEDVVEINAYNAELISEE